MIEPEKLKEMLQVVDKFSEDFMRLVPFGRGGSDKRFREVAKKFEEFKKAFGLWVKGKMNG